MTTYEDVSRVRLVLDRERRFRRNWWFGLGVCLCAFWYLVYEIAKPFVEWIMGVAQ